MKKVVFISFLLFSTPVLSCKLGLTEINPSGDWLEIVNRDNDICSGNLTLSGNLRTKDSFKTERYITGFTLSGKNVILITNDCSNFSGINCIRLNKTFRIFDDTDLKYSIIFNNIFQTGYSFSSGMLTQNDTGSLSLTENGWIWTGASPGFFNSRGINDTNSSNTNNLNFFYCEIITNNSGNTYFFNLSGNSSFKKTKIKRYKNNIFLTSSINFKIQIISGNNTFTAEIFSGDKKICKTSYKIEKKLETIYKNQCNIFTGVVKITEVHPLDDKFPEYIEITSIGNWSGQIYIKGLGKGNSSKSVKLTLFSGQRIIITDSTGGFDKYNLSNDKIIVLPYISLTDNGENLTILDESGHILDNVYYTKGETNKSLYFSGEFSGDTRIFNHIDISTPVLNLKNITPYLQNQGFNTGVEFYIKIQNTSPFFSEKSVNLIAVFSGKEISNSERNFECKWFVNDKLFSTGCNPYYYKIKNSGIIPVKLEILNKKNNIKYTTYSFINYPSKPECNCSCGSCRENYYHNLYLKRKNKYYQLKKLQKNIQNKSQKIEKNYILLTGILEINSILPNPKGKDKNKEIIKILAHKNLKLNGIFLQYGKNKKFYLSGNIKSGQILTITGNFNFSNKGDCIHLLSGNFLLDKLCYIKPKSGQLILRQNRLHLDTEINQLKILSNIVLQQKEDKFCIYYKKEKINCKAIRIKHINEYKKLKENYKDLNKKYKNFQKRVKICVKKIVKIFKNMQKEVMKKNNDIKKLKIRLNKLEIKIEKINNKYKQLKNDCKIKKEKIKSFCEKQKEKLKQQKEYYKNLYQKVKQKYNIIYHKYRLYKNFANIQKTIIKNKRKPIREKEGLDNIDKVVKTLNNYINSGFTEININGINIPIYDIKLYTKIKGDPIYKLIYELKLSSEKVTNLIDNLNKSLKR